MYIIESRWFFCHVFASSSNDRTYFNFLILKMKIAIRTKTKDLKKRKLNFKTILIKVYIDSKCNNNNNFVILNNWKNI